jgi:cytidine deaminase
MGRSSNVTAAGKNDGRIIRDRLEQLLTNAYAPYSKFRVAAAVVDENEAVHYGVNVENQSFSVATCAEAGAISALHAAGGKRIKRLYLLSAPNIEVVPCGACRQRLAEFGDPEMLVVTFGDNAEESALTLGELFPHGFRFK